MVEIFSVKYTITFLESLIGLGEYFLTQGYEETTVFGFFLYVLDKTERLSTKPLCQPVQNVRTDKFQRLDLDSYVIIYQLHYDKRRIDILHMYHRDKDIFIDYYDGKSFLQE